MPFDITQEQWNDVTSRLAKLEARDTAVPHKHNRVDMYAVDYGDLDNRAHFVQYRALAPTTANTVAVVGGTFVAPFGGTVISVGAAVDTAGVTGTETIDILKNGTTIMATTKITIDTGKTTSAASATQPALTVLAFAAGDAFTFSVTAIHSGTAALGLTVFMRIIQLTP